MIHPEHPFLPAEGDRDLVRRFRGRLASPVTIVTAGTGAGRAGLTVSSLFVVEGEPALIYAQVGLLTDLWEAVGATGRFVVHVCANRQQPPADVFAGLRPSPGGMFAGVEHRDTEWGPALAGLPDRAFCRLRQADEVGYSGVVVGEVERIEVSDLTDPLVHFRGGYRRLA
ncbi:MAG: flavin reductase family protein [Acidimicrobiia bacterium]|jgi:3-hydroxy-9,10-secoandrosta-1,3,5(10)-triene-9,17-dione monooxygenase reductase component